MSADLPLGWSERKLTDVVALPTGQVDPQVLPYREQPLLAPDHIESTTGRIIELKTADSQRASSGKYVVRPGDVALSKIRPSLRKVAIAQFAGTCSADMYPLRPKVGLLPEVLHAVLLGERFSLFAESVSGRTGIPKLNRDDLASYVFRLPSEPEQRRIAEILDAITESERAVEAAIYKLRALRRGILLDGMAAITASETPDGWERLPLKEVVPSVDYGISVALNDDSRGVATLRMNNLRDGRPYLNELRYCPQKVHPKHLLRMDDVLFNRTNSIDHVGRSGIWRGELEEATFASYLVRLNPDVERVIPQFLVEWLLHPVIRQRVRAIATVAVQQVNVNPTRLRELYIDLPTDLGEQKKLVASLEVCDRRIATEKESLGKLRVVKRGLADALLNGKRLVCE
ncbi:restriction endonuclease subunit S [Streptomyces rimosus]|uniref:restriction endonuclease subunit S n=1 Tax=Streptomyces rimosus TaxID=1927 RepID=UPI000995ED2A|nr:restriction endonuclease subunit S [Streptomyces rimosus]